MLGATSIYSCMVLTAVIPVSHNASFTTSLKLKSCNSLDMCFKKTSGFVFKITWPYYFIFMWFSIIRHIKWYYSFYSLVNFSLLGFFLLHFLCKLYGFVCISFAYYNDFWSACHIISELIISEKILVPLFFSYHRNLPATCFHCNLYLPLFGTGTPSFTDDGSSKEI